jgi:TRAP-type C4-dicarboxylate transport system substrate-binding protein
MSPSWLPGPALVKAARPRHHGEVTSRRSLALAWLLLGCLASLPALTVKIGTLAPEGSPWVDALRRVAAEWDLLSEGKVTLKIYAGGIAGEEADMVRKLRIGQLQGAALTQLGLGLLDPGILAISVPFLIQDEPELDYVLARSRPYYAGRFESKGYRLPALVKGGWVHFFARRALTTPAELQRLKLAVPEGDAEFVNIWRRMGFNAFSLPINDLLTGLETGMADAFYAPLLAAASFQWFGAARFMPSVTVAPVIGGILISSRVLSEVAEPLRTTLLEPFTALERRLNVQMEGLEKEALEAMLRHGLTVVPVPPQDEALWRELGAGGTALVIGKSLPLEAYQRVLTLVEEYRR